ncbi:hypothetical protein OAU17_01950 [Acidimicrobiia bacterium]|nr:hypothetical protein [Acidimicrobiia bacterium]
MSSEELHNVFDEKAINILNFFLKRGEIIQPEHVTKSGEISYKIPPEHLEIWFSQAIGWESIGAGNYPIDLISKDKKSGADVVKVVYRVNKDRSLSLGTTNEKSIFQKFGDDLWGKNEEEDTLDEMFIKENLMGIGNSANNIFFDKINSVKGIDNLYYFYFLFPPAGVDDVYLCGLKVMKDHKLLINNLELTSQKKSVVLHDFIDSRYGQTKVYKAKKRFEIRLRASTFVENGKVIKLNVNNKVKAINLRNLSDEDFESYVTNKFKDQLN